MKPDSKLIYVFAILIFFFLIITLFIGEDVIVGDTEMTKMTGTGAIIIEQEPVEEEEINDSNSLES